MGVKLKFQVADVHKPLIAVRRLVELSLRSAHHIEHVCNSKDWGHGCSEMNLGAFVGAHHANYRHAEWAEKKGFRMHFRWVRFRDQCTWVWTNVIMENTVTGTPCGIVRGLN